MKYVLFILIFVFPLYVLSQYDTTWTHTYGGAGNDHCEDMIATHDGGLLLVGSTSSFGVQSAQMYFLKLDSIGNIQWSRNYGGAGIEWAKSVVQTTDKGYVAVGYTTSYGNGGYDAYIIKIDSNGNYKWDYANGGTDWDFLHDVIEYQPGEYIVCGKTNSYNAAKTDGWIFKISENNSAPDWEAFYTGAEEEVFHAVAKANDGSILAVGSTSSEGNGDRDILISRYDSDGTFLNKKLWGDTLSDAFYEIKTISNNNFLATGHMTDTITQNSDIFTAEIDLTGDTVWSERWANLNGFGNRVLERPDGHPAVFGEIIDGNGKTDFFFIFMGYNGGGTFGSTKTEEARGLALLPNGRTAFAGNTEAYDATFYDIIVYYADDRGKLDDASLYDFIPDNQNLTTIETKSTLYLDFKVFPNPTINSINYQSNRAVKVSYLKIHTTLGQEVVSIDEPKFPFSLESLTHGGYYCTFYLSDGNSVAKYILKK